MAFVELSEMKHEVYFYAPDRVIDANGHYADADRLVCTLRAAVRGLSGKERVEYGMDATVECLQIIVRWCMRAELNTDLVMVWRGHRYQVLYIDPTPFAGQYLRVRVQRIEGSGGEWIGDI